MSLTATPNGLTPAYHSSGEVAAVAHPGVLLAGTNVSILKNQAVFLGIGAGAAVNGVTVPAGQVYLAPVVASTTPIWGVLAGVEYLDSTGAPVESNCWVASTGVFTGSVITAWIWEDPEIIYTIQSDGALPVISAVGTPYAQFDGREANLSNFTAGSTTTGLSQETLAAALVASAAQGQLRVMKLDPTVANQSSTSDAYVQLQVQIARSQVVAPAVSIT
jgi:hypothetical protein